MKTLKDAIYGFVVGDALGVPVEFRKRGSFLVEEMTGYGSHNQPVGTWSDDSSMTLATCHSIKGSKCLDYDDIMKKFVSWYKDGRYTPDGCVFDIGCTTQEALQNYLSGNKALNCGMESINSNGNGSLMRILPLAFTVATNEEIANISKLTHAHAISIKACQVYVNVARGLLRGAKVLDILKEYKFIKPFDRLNNISHLTKDDILSSGYVVHTLEAALWCLLTTNSYEECVLKAVNLGDDTDTTGAVAGGIAGIMYGIEGIPQEWINKIRNRRILENCLFE